jgi:putative SOS response-associated peptidase YedK
MKDKQPATDYKLWLDSGVSETDRLVPLFRPYPPKKMEVVPVGTIVNNPKMEDPRCITPIETAG